MIKINYNKKYGDEDSISTWSKTGQGEKCVKLTLTVIDLEDNDTEKYDYFVQNSDVIIENDNCIIFHSNNQMSKYLDQNQRDFISCEYGQELKVATQNLD